MKIDSTGVTPTSLADYKTELEEIFKSALGEDLNLASETPQGQLIGLLALADAETDEVAVKIANGLSLIHATGTQLDILGSLLLISRVAGERSTVTATLTGTAGTIVTEGARAKTTGGDIFVLDEQVTIPAAGTVDAVFRAEKLGPVAAAAGTLTTLETVISGLTGITNAAAAVPGRNAETHNTYRDRIEEVIAHNGRDGLENIRASVLQVEGCRNCLVAENTTAALETQQGVDIAARSILVIAEGGTNADVAEAILRSKPAGVATVGAVLQSVTHGNGLRSTDIRFTRVVLEPIAVNVSIRLKSDFLTNGIEEIRKRCAAWIAGTFEALGNDFDTGGVDIAEDIDTQRILTPIQSVRGHTVVSYSVTLQDGDPLPATIDLNKRYTLAEADVAVAVVT